MAKVKQEMIEAAIVKLIDKINSTMPNSTYKFLIGGAAGVLTATNLTKINGALNIVKDEHGLIDTEEIRKIYTSAFKSSNGKLQIELFNKPDSLLALFVKPVTLTITLDDIEQLMKDVEQNSVVTEVSLAPATAAT